MELDEPKSLAFVSFCVASSMSYARFVSGHTDAGNLRFLLLLPVFCLLLWLPTLFSTIHLRGISAFFLTWLSFFKLLLLSFGAAGPLSPSLPLFPFFLSATLPLKFKLPDSKVTRSSLVSRHQRRLLFTVVKVALLAALVSSYRYKDEIHIYLLLLVYCFHVYLAADLIFAAIAAAAEVFLPKGLELEPQFDAPFLAASLTEFWGRRWNLMVPAILRPSVYLPIRTRYGRAAGVLATFFVSGIMHEVVFSYILHAPPSGEATAFFVLHGAFVVAEGWARSQWRPPAVVSVPVTLAVMTGTAAWLFFPPLLRNGGVDQVVAESTAILESLKGCFV